VLWVIGFLSTKKTEGHIRVYVPSLMCRILFLVKFNKKVLLQSVLCQIWLYVMTILVFITSYLRITSIFGIILNYQNFVRISIMLYCILFIPDAIIYELRNKGDN
jgi:hypothetical protein